MKKITLTTFLIVFLSSSLVMGQDYTPIKNVDVLKKHEKVLAEIQPRVFKQLEIESVYKIDNNHTAIGFTKENTYSEVVVNDSREEMLLVVSSVEVSDNKAPKIIKDVWKKEYGKLWTLDKILYSKTPYGEDFYTMVMYKMSTNGDKKWNRIFYNNLGQLQAPLF